MGNKEDIKIAGSTRIQQESEDKIQNTKVSKRTDWKHLGWGSGVPGSKIKRQVYKGKTQKHQKNPVNKNTDHDTKKADE